MVNLVGVGFRLRRRRLLPDLYCSRAFSVYEYLAPRSRGSSTAPPPTSAPVSLLRGGEWRGDWVHHHSGWGRDDDEAFESIDSVPAGRKRLGIERDLVRQAAEAEARLDIIVHLATVQSTKPMFPAVIG